MRFDDDRVTARVRLQQQPADRPFRADMQGEPSRAEARDPVFRARVAASRTNRADGLFDRRRGGPDVEMVAMDR